MYSKLYRELKISALKIYQCSVFRKSKMIYRIPSKLNINSLVKWIVKNKVAYVFNGTVSDLDRHSL